MPVTDKEKFTLRGASFEINVRRVESSNVEWIGWPSTGDDMMVVQFRGGRRYAYLGVTRQRAVAAAHSPSTGGYLHRAVKSAFEVVKLA